MHRRIRIIYSISSTYYAQNFTKADKLKKVVDLSAETSNLRYVNPVVKLGETEKKGARIGLYICQLWILLRLSGWRFEKARECAESRSFVSSNKNAICRQNLLPKIMLLMFWIYLASFVGVLKKCQSC